LNLTVPSSGVFASLDLRHPGLGEKENLLPPVVPTETVRKAMIS